MGNNETALPALPGDVVAFMDWPWEKIEPHFHALEKRALTADTVDAWLADWSRLSALLSETYSRLYVATTVNTADAEAEKKYHHFLDAIFPPASAAEQKLKEKLLGSGLQTEGFAVPLQKMRAEAELFREENLSVMTAERKLATEYEKVIGAQTIEWEGEEITLLQLQPVYQGPDRDVREKAWRLAAERQLADRETINDLWTQFMDLRRQLAANTGLPDYRAFRWQQMLRFDYTPDDCAAFHQAIAAVIVPAAQRIYEKRRQRLGVDALRPWDLFVDPLGRPPLRPFGRVDELIEKSIRIFSQVDPLLGGYFRTMRDEKLLDLDNRKNKAPGGYCMEFQVAQRPFIFMNAVGLHDDVQTLLHEAGHCFHVFERAHLPYLQQKDVNLEFAEVASMSMELLGAPYLAAGQGGFYPDDDAARAQIEHLEDLLLFWPFMSVVDSFQHWVYQNHDAASDPAACDAAWDKLWQRFMLGVDWTGLEEERKTGWHRKLHIHLYPFYYVEY
ncbi:MAG: M3 family oligoendopeptidase, partial [Alphaproteobacteria bacterium]